MRTMSTMKATFIALLVVISSAQTSPSAQQRGAAPISVEALFTPSGYMGDGEYGRKYIDMSGADRTAPHSPPTAFKVTYTFGPMRWGGVYWQNEPDNWGDKPGTNYVGKGYSRLSFWARGETGTEVVEFKSGGIDNRAKKYRDSFSASIGRITLTREWKQYQIDLKNTNLGSVIGVFCWVVASDYNPGKQVTFYVDDVILE